MSPGLDTEQRFRAEWRPGAGIPLHLLLSGGGDSTALFRLLLAGGHAFSCIHFQHDSKGTFPLRAAEFCATLCARHQVGLEVMELDAAALSQLGDVSWEAAARQLRYNAVHHKPGLVLTAHSADDQAETVIMRLLDGAGLAGLSAIRAERGDGVVRPLLGHRRQELRDYLRQLGQEWVDDPTNQDGNDRARLRARLLPLLEAERPGLVHSLCRTASSLALDEDALTEAALAWMLQNNVEEDHWPVEPLLMLAQAVRYRVFRQIWRQACPGPRRPLGSLLRECERLARQAADDRHVPLPGGCRLRKLGEWIWVEPSGGPVPWSVSPPKGFEGPLMGEGWTLLPPGEHEPKPRRDWQRLALPEGMFAEGEQYAVRSRLPGDRYGGRSLKKLLAATRQPPWVRDRWPLLVSRGEVVGVPGIDRFKSSAGNGWLLFDPAHWRWRPRKM